MLFRSDRKSTRLNSSHTIISYAGFCLKKKKRRRECGRRRGDSGAGPQCAAWLACSPGHAHALPTRTRRTRASLRPSLFFFFFLMIGRPPRSPLFPYPTLFRSKPGQMAKRGTKDEVIDWSVDLGGRRIIRSEEHTSELQSHDNLVCRLLLEK